MRTIRLAWFVGFALVGCERYQGVPLDPAAVVASVTEARQGMEEVEGHRPFTFPRAAALMARHAPSLQEARAEYETALAVAQIKTPFPNPSLEAGPRIGFGPDAADPRLQPFASIGVTIPTGPRRARQDDLNRLAAELAFVEAQARHRELYLDLRHLYSEWILTKARLETRQTLSEAAETALSTGRKLVETGFASPLDTGLLELETARTRLDALNARRELASIEGDLAEIIGVQTGLCVAPPGALLPELPPDVPDIQELTAFMVANHPGLARLRARYEVTEAELRLEVARQYPDLHLGPSLEEQLGEQSSVLGLPLGIELPVFDRNQQGIAAARQRREEIRAKYEAAANRALAALDRSRWNLQLAQEKWKLVREVFLAGAEANIRLARKLHEGGSLDLLHLLETERSQRAVLIEASDAELATRKAWVDLERAVGIPLIRFPGEEEEAVPSYAHASTRASVAEGKE